MNTISRKRLVEECLEFKKVVVSVNEAGQQVRYIIVDRDGIEYDGVLNEDGSLFDGFTEWQNSDVFDRFVRSEGNPKPIAKKYRFRWCTESLFFNDITSEFFLLLEYSSAGMFYMSSISSLEAALWFVELECDQELIIHDKPFIGFTLPDEIMDRVLDKTWAVFESRAGWTRQLIEKALESDSKVTAGDGQSVDRRHIPSEAVSSTIDRIRGKQRNTNEVVAAGVATQEE